MKQRMTGALGVGLLMALALLFVALVGADRGEAAPTLLKGSFRGHAYATFANAEAGPVAATLGRSAFQPCPCRGTNGETRSNTVDSVATTDNGRTLRANGTLSTVFTEKSATSARVKNTSKVAGLSAFKEVGQEPLIQADAIKAVANVSANASAMKSSSEGSTFLNLRIAGNPIEADVAPNTRVELPGVGHVILKGVSRGGDGERLRTIQVEMLTVVVEENNTFGLPVGSRVVVAHAVAGFSRNVPEVIVGGNAYAAAATATTDVIKNRVGRAAFITMGCAGTGGKTKTNNINTLDVDEVLSSGTGVTTAFGGPTSSGTVAKTTARVQDLSLLNGLISADAVKAVAKDTFRDGKRISSTKGTQFVELAVAGQAIPVDVAPNTRIDLPGIGFVIVNEQMVPDPNSEARLQVNGLRVQVTQDNALGLPKGTRIIVAHAESTAVRFLQA
jgi:hypothetical protein